jgi:hypothetical protein
LPALAGLLLSAILLLLAGLLLSATLLLLAGLRLTAALLATLLLLAGLWLTAALLTTLLLTTLLLAGILVWILIHRSSSPTLVRGAASIGCVSGKKPMHRRRIRSRSNTCFTFQENVFGTRPQHEEFPTPNVEDRPMGRYMLLWLIGVPIPILVLIWLFGGLH